MPLVIDWDNSIISITSPTVSVDMQTLHDFIEDEMATPQGLSHADIIVPQGKIEDPSNPGIFSQIIVILSSLWQIQFWQGSGYTRIYGGKLVGGVSNQPLKATGHAGDITVLESPVDGVTVATSSGTLLTPEQDAMLTEMWQLQGLDANNPMTVTKTARTAGDINLDISGSAETSVTVVRQ